MEDVARRQRIGFIGLGNMGRPMASRLAAANYQLVVNDLRTDTAAPLIGNGAIWADSPRHVAELSDVICTSLPGPVESENVFFGDRGILNGVRTGSCLIDFTTNSASLVRRMNAALQKQGASLLDAPVSGGVEAAGRGQLTLLVGGDPEVLAKCEILLQNLAQSILYTGPVGTASICKALHNCAVFCTNLAMMECFTAGVKAGVDAATLIEVFQKSGIGCNLDLQIAMPATLFRGMFVPPRFSMKTARKDMRLATELAREVQAPMRLAELCEAEMDEAIQRGWDTQDNTIFLTLQEERAGVRVRVKGEAVEHPSHD